MRPGEIQGAKPRTRHCGAAHHEHVLETVYWDACTARLLPRLLRGRTHGPVFVTHPDPDPESTSPTGTCAPTPDSHDCPTTRPAISSTPAPRPTVPEPGGACANSATPATPTSANPARACSN
ncbi:hypothetical protein [Nocardia pseudovaccinii]|uniref:hypothetical protein n=1 Tax=Nocardia pseudovaccinii TaxID=189540 RepID=UPI000B0ADE5C|nr:hypothetical protein [Nocardia pseudovaccinii]